jgi:hypothetical protein
MNTLRSPDRRAIERELDEGAWSLRPGTVTRAPLGAPPPRPQYTTIRFNERGEPIG